MDEFAQMLNQCNPTQRPVQDINDLEARFERLAAERLVRERLDAERLNPEKITDRHNSKLIWDKIHKRDQLEHDLPPGGYLHYNNPILERDNMAADIIQNRHRVNLTRKKKLNQSHKRLQVAKMPLDNDTVQLLSKYITKGGMNSSETKKNRTMKGGMNSSVMKSNKMRTKRLMRMDPEYRMNTMATRLQSRYRGNMSRSRLQQEYYEPIKSRAPELLKHTAESNIDIQDTIGEHMKTIRYQQSMLRLQQSNLDLIDYFNTNIKSSRTNPAWHTIPYNIKLQYYTQVLLYKGFGQQIIMTLFSQDEFSINMIKHIFKLPKDISEIIATILDEMDDDIDPSYGEVNLPKLLMYFAHDDTNLQNFINRFNMMLNLTDYNEIQILEFINTFLTIIQP